MSAPLLPVLLSAPLLVALSLAGPQKLVAQEAPDSVIELEPVEVRILRSPLGSGVPAAVSTVSRAELTRARSGAYLEEALRALPGVQIQNRFNLASGERLMIRGFGSRAQFGIRGVRVLVDGIPATLPDGQTALDHLDAGALQRADIIRGPASSLYGNAAGGVLQLRTSAPAEAAGSSATVTAGSNGLAVVRGETHGRLAPDSDFRLAVQRFSFDGFRRDPVADDGSTYGGAERTVVNATVAFPLASGQLRVVGNGLDMDARNPGSLNGDVLAQGDRQAHRFSVLQQTREEVRQGQLGLSWTGDVRGSAVEISTWGIHRQLDGPIPPRIIELRRNAGGARVLLRNTAAAGTGVISFGLGAEAEFQSDHRRNWENERGQKGALSIHQQERVRGLGIFAQARWDPTPGLGVSAGVRYDRSRFEATDRFVGPGEPDDSGSRIMDALSPTAGLVWSPTRKLEIFASASRSFETPTTTELVNRPNGAGGFNPELDPQRGTTLEGGLRARMDNRWSAEATLFQTELTRELVPFEVPDAPGRSYFRNAGASRHRGWELALDGRPSDGVSLRLAYTRVDARFTDFALDGADYDGNQVPGLAPWVVDTRLALERGPAFVMIRGLVEDDIPVDNAGTAVSEGYLLMDVRAGLSELRRGATLVSPFVAVTNVLDRRYNASVVVNAFGGRYYEPGPPRSFQAGVNVRWGG